MIRYLPQEEKCRTRAVYETNFPEDSKEFVDYYYKEKIKDDQILVMEEGGKLEVMIHLNPYLFQVCGQQASVNYVVAVATDASVRRQGKMAAVLERALRDMAKEGQPFTFLIPANPEVYRSSGFAFVTSEAYSEGLKQLEEKVAGGEGMQTDGNSQGESGTQAGRLCFRRAAAEDHSAMAAFANRLLAQEYDLYPYRTAAYYARLAREMACQNGGLVLLVMEKGSFWQEDLLQGLEYGADQIVGIFSYGREDGQVELQEILVKKEERQEFFSQIREYLSKNLGGMEEQGKSDSETEAVEQETLQRAIKAPEQESSVQITRMDFMFRILDLKALVPMLRSRKPFVLRVQVQDRILPENAGAYEIRLDRQGGTITDISAAEAECSMDIAKLAECLFEKVRIFIREWV